MATYSGDKGVKLLSGIRNHLPSSSSSSWVFIFVAGFYVAWIITLIIVQNLHHHFNWLSIGSSGGFALDTFVRLVVWVLPAIVFIHFTGKRLKEVYAVDRWRAAVIWGVGGYGLWILAIALTGFMLGIMRYHPLYVNWNFLSGVLVAPIVEELFFRGAVLDGLLQRYRFFVANTIQAILFLGAHLPGWYIGGNLITMLENPVSGALAIFIAGWMFGVVKYKSQSLVGDTLAHMLNNLVSTLL